MMMTVMPCSDFVKVKQYFKKILGIIYVVPSSSCVQRDL